jgi:23S rRNA-/tRNA-specific pseudouridylate synthase
VTAFQILDDLGPALLVEARPETGRKHQIRAHLSGTGMPILGDRRYGGPVLVGDCMAPRVMLHALRLSLRHPVTGEPLDLTCPYPVDFAALLLCLRRQRARTGVKSG